MYIPDSIHTFLCGPLELRQTEILLQDSGGKGGCTGVKSRGKPVHPHKGTTLSSSAHPKNPAFSLKEPRMLRRIPLLLASKKLYWVTVNKKQLNLLKVCEIRSNLFGDLEKTSKQKSWVIDCCISAPLNLKWNQDPKARDPDIHSALVRRPTCQSPNFCSMAKLVGKWHVAERCGHWAFLGHKRRRKSWHIFLSVKQWSKLSSPGQHSSSPSHRSTSPNQQTFSPALDLSFMRCCHSIIFPQVGLYPFDIQRQRGQEGNGSGGQQLARKEKDADLKLTTYVAFLSQVASGMQWEVAAISLWLSSPEAENQHLRYQGIQFRDAFSVDV